MRYIIIWFSKVTVRNLLCSKMTILSAGAKINNIEMSRIATNFYHSKRLGTNLMSKWINTSTLDKENSSDSYLQENNIWSDLTLFLMSSEDVVWDVKDHLVPKYSLGRREEIMNICSRGLDLPMLQIGREWTNLQCLSMINSNRSISTL